MMKGFEQIPIGQVRDFWNQQPCNIYHSPKSVGTKAYFEEVEARRYYVESHIPHFAQFGCWRGKKVLEIGCGIGTDTINFARHGAHVTAIELSEESLRLARQQAKIYDLQDQIQFYCGDAEKLDSFLPIESYDLIYSFGAIHHTPYPERVIEQIRHYAGPNSVVKIMVYHRYAWKVFCIMLAYGKGQFWRLGELVAQYSEAQTGCPVTYTFSRSEAQKLLERYGFQVKEIYADYIFPYRISDYRRYHYAKVWYFYWMPKLLFRQLMRRFGWHLCITAETK